MPSAGIVSKLWVILTVIQYVNTMCNIDKVQIGCQGNQCYHIVKATSGAAAQASVCSDCQYSSPRIDNANLQDLVTAGFQGKGLNGFAWIGGVRNTLNPCAFVKGNTGPVKCSELDDRIGALVPNYKILLTEVDDKAFSGVPLCRRDGCNVQNVGNCLSISSATSSWYTARNRCLETGSELMYLETGEEDKILDFYLAVISIPGFNTANKYWTGLRKYRWTWGDGNEVKYTNWKFGYPLDGSHIAMDMTSGNWESRNPGENNFVLCMTGSTNPQPVPQPTPGPAPSPTPAPGPTLAPGPAPAPQPIPTPLPPVTLRPPDQDIPVDVSRVREFRDSGFDAPWEEGNSVCSKQSLKPAIVRYPTDQEIMNGIKGKGDFWLAGRLGSTAVCSFTEDITPVPCDIITTMGNDFTVRFFDQSKDGQMQALPLCRTPLCVRSNFNCLTFGDITSSWYEARNQCLKQGADLFFLTADDRADIEAVKRSLIAIGTNFLNKQFWVGLRQHVWHWLEDNYVESEMKFTNWEGGQPIVDIVRYRCVAVDMSTGKWRTETCQKFSSVLCAVLQSYTGKASSMIHSSILMLALLALHIGLLRRN